MDEKKTLIFISHANPNDNDATLWLASKLVCSGYEVWSDLTKLFGGEIFWEDIEEAIRHHSAKFVILVSHNSQNAQGVLDEVNLAVTLERKQDIHRFVIPIRLDGIPFDEFRVNIARKNVIDFSKNWFEGLNKLLKVLEEDDVPRKLNNDPIDVSQWYKEHHANMTSVVHKSQSMTSNWLPILRMPKNLYLSKITSSVNSIHEYIEALPYPSFSYQQYVGSFTKHDELMAYSDSEVKLIPGCTVKARNFMKGNVKELPSLQWPDNHNLLSGLLRKAWNSEMNKRGMLKFQLSDYSEAWFFPQGFIDKNEVEFIDANGKKRKKQLIGRSEKLDVFWHFALSVRPSFGRLRRFVLKPHVIFTRDGHTPLESKEKMHALRRGFCRSWWNERWRGLLLAYLTHLARESSKISLKISPRSLVKLSARPYNFVSPISIAESLESYVENVEDIFIDEALDYIDDDEWDLISDITDDTDL